MTDGISVSQFQTQVNQAGTQNLDAKIKLDGDGGLKTFGKSFLGKVACWFQKSSTRKTESNQVRKSFVDALRKEYGSTKAVNSVLDNVRGGGKRLSLRTARTALSNLNSDRDSFGQQALSLYSKTMANKGVSEQLKNMGYEKGSLDENQLSDMVDEITKELARLGKNANESTVKNKAKEVIVGFMAKNLPINTAEDAFKLLSNAPAKSMNDAVQRVFDHFKGQEGGLQKLQDCSLKLMGLEIDKTKQESTLLRSNSTASKLLTKTLEHMTETQNNALVRKISGLVPKEVPAPFIDKNTGAKDYKGYSSQYNNPEFFKLSDQLSKACFNEIQNTWAKNISPETKSFFNGIVTTANDRGKHLGEGIGKKTLGAVLMLRLINASFVKKEIAQINNQIKELNKSNNPDKENLINSLNGRSKVILNMTKPLQVTANSIGLKDQENFITKSKNVPQELVPFLKDNLNAFNTMLDNVSKVSKK